MGPVMSRRQTIPPAAHEALVGIAKRLRGAPAEAKQKAESDVEMRRDRGEVIYPVAYYGRLSGIAEVLADDLDRLLYAYTPKKGRGG